MMEPLRQRDYRAVLGAVESCYGARNVHDFRRMAAAAVRRLISADRASYNVVGRAFSAVFDPPAEGLPGAVQTLTWYTRHYAQMQAEHPLLLHWRRTGHGGAVRTSDFMTRRQFHGLALYNEALRHLGTEHMFRISLPVSRTSLAGITLGRGRRDFSERDKAMLNLLRPHLVEVDRQVRLTARLRRQVALAAAAVESAPVGVIALDGSDAMTSIDDRALELLERYFGPPAPRTPLPDEVLRWMRHQRRAAGALDDGPAPRRPLIVRREHAFLVVSPLIDGGRQLVLLEERVTVPAAELPVAAGLTRRETDVLILAAQGRSNREIAAVLDMGARTVDKHLERIYDRLRVRPRNAAVAHALRVLAAARARPRL